MYRVARMLTVVALIVGFSVSEAWASGWPVSATDVLLGFAEDYQRPDGSTASHSGVDIVAAPGEVIQCATGGVVTFAGTVPSASGGSMLVVTVQTASGDKWSYSPLSEIWVDGGRDAAAGIQLGTVADSGDPSSSASHVHVSVRRGERYIDALPLMTMPAVENGQAEPQSDMETDTSPVSQSVAPQPVASPAVAAVASGATEANSAPAAMTPVTVSEPLESAPQVALPSAEALAGGHVAAVGSSALSHDPQILRARGPQASGGAISGQEAAVSEVGLSADPKTTTRTMRFLLALSGLAPVLFSMVKRAIRGDVMASGETVAAAVGR